jgi:hypothetical protein
MKECAWSVSPAGEFLVRRSDNPDQQFLIEREPDLRPLRKWVVERLSRRPERWQDLHAAIRPQSLQISRWIALHFVVVFNLTRFARDKYDHFALRSHLQSLGISLRSATEPIDDTSTGKLMEGVLAAFAQFDNDCRSDRTRAGMKAALELGRWVFLAPIGYLNAPQRWARAWCPTRNARRSCGAFSRSTPPGASPSSRCSSRHAPGA